MGLYNLSARARTFRRQTRSQDTIALRHWTFLVVNAAPRGGVHKSPGVFERTEVRDRTRSFTIAMYCMRDRLSEGALVVVNLTEKALREEVSGKVRACTVVSSVRVQARGRITVDSRRRPTLGIDAGDASPNADSRNLSAGADGAVGHPPRVEEFIRRRTCRLAEELLEDPGDAGGGHRVEQAALACEKATTRQVVPGKHASPLGLNDSWTM